VVTIEPELNQRLIEKLKRESLRKLGYHARKTMDPVIANTLEEALDISRQVVRPKGAYRILPVLKIMREGVHTAFGVIQSAMFARLAKMCRPDPSLVFMAATLKEGFENACGPQEPIYRQFVFDTVGSVLVEIVADLLESDWKAEATHLGFQCGMRFSPGYCDWPLEGQGVIAEAMELEALGVHLTRDFVMLPRKSISAVAVMAKEVPIPAPCGFCVKDNCLSRRLAKQKIFRPQGTP
jgi:hypothetical protein